MTNTKRETIDPSYAVGELARTLRAAAAHTDPTLRARAERRAEAWLGVLENLAKGLLKIGHRQPYDVPVWVTPDVVRGGFASGTWAAGGALLPHEREAARPLGLRDENVRAELNARAISAEGLETLSARLRDRAYRVGVPEEGALLVVRWLIERGEHESAAKLLETIGPLFDRLRFYPSPGAPLPVPEAGIDAPVLRTSARGVAESLRKKKPSAEVETLREAVEVWAPMTDRLVSLVLETIEGEVPRIEGERVVGGMPFTRAAKDWDARRTALLAELDALRGAHTRCRRPHRKGEVLATLREALAADVATQGWIAGRVQHRLAGFVSAYGVPGSPEHTRLRASQRVGPSHALLGHVLAARLDGAAEPGDGLDDPSTVTHPILDAEASPRLPAGTPLPRRAIERASHARQAPLAALAAHGLVGSGEVLATLLPQLTGPALATRFDDPAARTLYAASYRAFRQRRSLLLLWLQHQVRFAELPWIAAMEASTDRGPEAAVRETLRQLAAFAIATFPETITPNKLVSELAALAAQAGLSKDDDRPALPLVEEVASDIFMGTFSLKFLRAAQVAAALLPTSSPYVRYYGLDPMRVLSMNAIAERWNVKTSPQFDAYCLELAALPAGGNPRARNGVMIEQASILTTHNLAALVRGLDLGPLLAGRWVELATRAYVAVLDRLERRVIPERGPKVQRMRAAKTLAFAWRQMLFYLSMAAPEDAVRFDVEARARLAERPPIVRERFEPVLRGLSIVVGGRALGRHEPDAPRLYGWSVERPFLMGPEAGDRTTR